MTLFTKQANRCPPNTYVFWRYQDVDLEVEMAL